MFEIKNQNSYQQHIKLEKNDIVVDIGGHGGYFSIFASKITKNKIIVFEPDPTNYGILCKNIDANKITNIFPSNIAISDKSQKSFLKKGVASGSYTLIPSTSNLGGETTQVQAWSLESIIEHHKLDLIDFLKIDCEGSEYRILPSLSSSIFSKVRKIALEYHEFESWHNHELITNLLKKNNFDVWVHPFRLFPGGYIYASNRNF